MFFCQNWWLSWFLRLDGTLFEQPAWIVLVEGLRCLTYLQDAGPRKSPNPLEIH